MPTSPFDLSEYAREATGPDVGTLNARESLDIDLTKKPYLVMSRQQLAKQKLDHRAGFLISLIDGVSTAEAILTVSGMPEDEVLVTLFDLHARGVIAFR